MNSEQGGKIENEKQHIEADENEELTVELKKNNSQKQGINQEDGGHNSSLEPENSSESERSETKRNLSYNRDDRRELLKRSSPPRHSRHKTDRNKGSNDHHHSLSRSHHHRDSRHRQDEEKQSSRHKISRKKDHKKESDHLRETRYDEKSRSNKHNHKDKEHKRSHSIVSGSSCSDTGKKKRSHNRSKDYSRRKYRSDSKESRAEQRERSYSKERRRHHRERNDRKEKSLSRRDCEKNSNINRQSNLNDEQSTVETKNLTVTGSDGSLNAADILKQIKVPYEYRNKPAQAAKYQMEQLRLKTEELTGVKVPSFYSTTAVNPLLYAEQQKKRKLLWSKAKDNENTTTSIVGRAIVEGKDEKTSEKFRKLMGIKSTDKLAPNDHLGNDTVELQMMQQRAFNAMDKEYEQARMSTHTHRGQGLGFASIGLTDPNISK